MANQEIKKVGAAPRGGLVQFRADQQLIAGLAQAADKLNLPVGTLARLWVSERLHSEHSLFDIATIEAWRKERYKNIDRVLEEEFNPGPIQILHLIPLRKHLEIEPERMRQLQSLLPPVERANEYLGSVDLEGYQTIKRFASADKLSGTVQVYRDGRVESVRVIRTDEHNCIYADYLDSDLIHAVWKYSCALEALKVELPLALFVAFKRVRGCCLKSRRLELPSRQIKYGGFEIRGISINHWHEVLKIENAAQAVKGILDQFANSAGLPKSVSYSAKGEWLGPIGQQDIYTRQTQTVAREGIMELAGTNRDINRVDLILHDGDDKIIIGKVRVPYLEPTARTRFKCLVNQDEMQSGAKQRLEYKQQMKLPGTFSVGNIKFSGFITGLVENLDADVLEHGIKVPQKLVLMFEIEPGIRGETPDQCASCGRALTPGQGRNTPSRGTLCRQCAA